MERLSTQLKPPFKSHALQLHLLMNMSCSYIDLRSSDKVKSQIENYKIPQIKFESLELCLIKTYVMI